jgi:pantothenate synthetase
LQAVKNSVWKSAAEAEAWAASQIQANPAFRLDYFQVLNGRDLSPIGEIAEEQAPVAFVAAFLGTTRLIDNVALYSYPV